MPIYPPPPAGGSGSVATDTIWDAKGDVAAATGADAAIRVALGANGTVLTADSTQTAGVKWAAAGVTSTTTLYVTADGTTNVAGTIQTYLDALAASHSVSNEVIIEPVYPQNNPLIYLNGKVRITTDDTIVKFRAPVLLGTGCDPDGFGCLSILGSVAGTTTTAAAIRGQTVVVVASATGFTAGMMIKINDADTSGGALAGYKSEVAEVIEVVGTSIYLSHPLHQTYTGTITVSRLTPVTNSGFEDAYCTFTGQQAASFLFPSKALYTRYCFYKNVHFKGTAADSWSREANNVRDSYRTLVDQCTASFSWDYAVGSTFSYGFSCEGSCATVYRACQTNNLRHGYTSDKGGGGTIYAQCYAENSIATGFDLHGNWATDILYVGCTTSGNPDGRQSTDTQHYGFLAGNTTFVNGVSNVSYVGCVARNMGVYTPNGGGSGNAAGFGVVDGCSNIAYQSCRVIDSQQGMLILSLVGQPINNVGIYECTFENLVSADPTPRPAQGIYVNAGTAPNDVNGLVIDGCKFVNCPTIATPIMVRGTSGNTLDQIVITNNVFTRSQGVAGTYGMDLRFLTGLVVKNNVFNVTRRGIIMSTCVGAIITENSFLNMTEMARSLEDLGGNTNAIFANNTLSPAPTALTTLPTSTGIYVEIAGRVGSTTANLPTLPAGSKGAQSFDTTLNRPVWWNGVSWVYDAPIAINAQSGTTYTTVLADAGKAIEVSNAATVTVTIPPNSSVAYPIGTIIEFTQLAAGQLTLAQGAGVTLRTPTGTLTARAQYSSLSIRKRATDEWIVAGDLS